jgi:hypothetical protein
VFPEAGVAAVRQGDTHLVLSAGFHNTTHKHADELSFELSEGGRRVVADTGMYHKDPGEVRDFVVAARAHNTLTVDGQDLPVADTARAYGSGIRAWGSGDGWHAVLASNPLLASQSAEHERLFLYRPATALVLVDRARAPGTHTFERYLQLAPGFQATTGEDAVLELHAPRFDGAVFDTGPPAEVALARGAEDPLAGYMASDYREWTPRTTVELSAGGDRLLRALTLSLDRGRTHATAVTWRAGEVVVPLDSGSESRRLVIEREGSALRVDER